MVLTGLEDELVGVQAIGMGVQDYISKNILSKGNLARTIRYAIERNGLAVEWKRLIG